MINKLFFKNSDHYFKKGEKLFSELRYAEARVAFIEALEKLSHASKAVGVSEQILLERIKESGDALARINIDEATHAILNKETKKAEDHLSLAISLAEDVSIRQKAETLMDSLYRSMEASKPELSNAECCECSHIHVKTTAGSDISAEHLPPMERFELLINTLPNGLAEKYRSLGEKFAYAYLLSHDGQPSEARKILFEELEHNNNDVIHYEIALSFYNEGVTHECEHHLNISLQISEDNPLALVGLSQLLYDTGRSDDAVIILNSMVTNSILPEQAYMLLGDIYAESGETDIAIDNYSNLLQYSKHSSNAAEKIVNILLGLGRNEEAKYLIDKYLKGCC